MKHLKKILILMLCVGVLMGMTACSSKEKNGATTNETTNETTKDNGMLEDIGEDVKDGARDMNKGMEDMTDPNQNGVPDKTTDPNMTNEGQ